MLIHERVDVLVVEDNESERGSIVQILQSSIRDANVKAVSDGPDALDFLFGRGAWTDRLGEESPRLILLDLEMPGADGFSVLGQIRSLEASEDVLNLTPVVIFTSSHEAGDVSKSYRCGANSYIMKPLSYPDFQAVVETIGRYWLDHNRAAN